MQFSWELLLIFSFHEMFNCGFKATESNVSLVKHKHVYINSHILFQVLLLIEGKVHAYVFASKGCKKWDTCAPEAILHGVGGTLTDFHGIRMNYSADVQRKNTGGVLATVADHGKFLGCIPEHIRDAMDKSSPAPELDFKGVVVSGGADLEKAKQNNGQVSAGKSPSPEENAESKSSSDKVPNDVNTKL